MRRCVTCEGLLGEDQFNDDSPICRICVDRLRVEYSVDYAPPERRTRKEAAVNLIIAVRDQAEKDEKSGSRLSEDVSHGGPMGTWKHYWVDSDPWRNLWGVLVTFHNRKAKVDV